MKITKASVNHPITTIMVFLALFILGSISLTRLGLELFPDVTLPTVVAVTVHPGVGPYEIESSVTRIVEDSVSSLNGLKEITSSSSEGVSMVILHFSWNTDLDTIIMDVREKLNSIENDLPEGAERTNIYKYNPEHLPTLIFNVSTKTRGIDTRMLTEELIIPELEKLEGVAKAGIYGGREKAVVCRLDLDTLSKLEIPIMQVLQVFQGENINLPAGSMTVNNKYMVLRTVGEFSSVEDIGLVLVGYKGLSPIFLKDVAEISLDYLPQEEFVRAGGETGVMVNIRKQPGYNTVKTNRAVLAKLDALKKDLPPSVNIQIQSDQSETVVRSIGGVANAAWQGGLLAILVLLFFLRNLRSTFIISIVIPVSLIATFSLMDFGGLTMNIVSLMGITLGVGMFVDNSIVVLESIFRHQLGGSPPEVAAVEGTAEVGKAITASTLTTVAVFIPMIFVQGMAGLIFDDLAGTISFALMISLAAALTLVPSLCAKFMKIEPGTRLSEHKTAAALTDLSLADLEIQTGNHLVDRLGKKVQKWLYALDNGYEKIIRWALRHVRAVIISALVLLALSISSILLLGMEFLPEADEGGFAVSLQTKIGSTYSYTEEKVIEIENILRRELGDNILSLSSNIGEGGEITGGDDVGSHLAVIYVKLVDKDHRKLSIWQILTNLDEIIRKEVLDIKYRLRVEGIATMAASASGEGNPVVIELSGGVLESLYAYALKTQGVLEETKGLRNIKVSHRTGKPEIQFIVKRREALSLGFTPREIAATLRTAYKGTEVTKFTADDEDYSVILVLEEEDRNTMDKIGSIFFINSAGNRIPLENLVDIKEGKGPLSIKRKKRTRMISVSASLTGDLPLSVVMENVQDGMKRLGPPGEGIELEYTGSGKEMNESFRTLFMALIFAVVLVYMVMASQFESLLHPFIVMFSVPFAAIGLVGALLLTGTTFSLMAFVGGILLVGIVVNNAIVLIDYINLLRKQGMPLKNAIIRGGKTRLKPILMTTLTTIFAMLPMSLGIGTGAELRAPMGRAVVGGLATSTLVTLVLIPTLYWIFEKAVRNRNLRKNQQIAAVPAETEISDY